MKKFFAIVMLVNILFNSFGYRIIAFILEKRAVIVAEEKFDKNDYDESKLIEIKIPFKLPYTTEWKDFERVNGEIEVNGKYYKYVKRKVITDSLVLLCLPNYEKLRLESARDRFFELVNGLKHPNQKKTDTPSVFKMLISDYITKENNWSANNFLEETSAHSIKNSALVSLFNYQKLIKPPNFLS